MTNRLRALRVICAGAAVAAAGAVGALAQSWGYDDGSSRERQQPSRPGYDQWGSQPYGQSGSGQQPVYGQPGYNAARVPGYVSPRCHELEVQLTGGASPNADQLPRIEADMRQADAQFHKAQADADAGDCYDDMLFFGRSLKRTPRCIDLDRQVQAAKSTLAQLKAQRDAITRGTLPKGRHDDLIAELAHNRCGEQYTREYETHRSRSSSIFSFFTEEEPEDTTRYATPSYGSGGASTYRTLCVRECDGFYFPISAATTESQFAGDDAKCRSQCAAPAELFYHRTDQDVEQMVSLRGIPYSQSPNAFRNRKVYIRGCSCNASEYSPEEIAKSEEALKTSKRADASASGSKSSAADTAFARRISQAVQGAPAQPQAQQPAPAPQTPPAAPAPDNPGH